MRVHRPAILILSQLVALGLIVDIARAQIGDIDRTESCNVLRHVDLATIQDAPTQVIEATDIGPSQDTPAHCRISGYVTPSVGFVLRLPAKDWNGKLAHVACGAFCGTTNDQLYAFSCDYPLRRGYACIVSDNGHRSTPFDALWAYNNLEAMIDQAYRGPHVTALAGKAIVERYYGQLPRRSYFMGCSNGGRQGLMAAQRFPRDYDGIIAGASELSTPEHFTSLLWASRSLTNSAGKALVSQAELEIVYQAVVAKCDLNDGLRDGLIGDPRYCFFDPSELICSSGKRIGCLSAEQVEAIENVYRGPMTSRGERIYMASALPGSERAWLPFTNDTSYPNTILREYFRYIAFQPPAGPSWKPQDFDFDHDLPRQALTKALYSAANPDLREFKAAGGKLLSYTGWSDVYVAPTSSVDYYESVERAMGGRALTQDFLRLFVMPGMGHCGGGEGASMVDYLTYLEDWVEQGQAPDKIISFHVNTDDLARTTSADPDLMSELKRRKRFPLDPAFIKFSRPVYPYPTRAKYLGHGDPTGAASFGPVKP